MRSSAFLIAAFLLFAPVFAFAQDTGLVPRCDVGTYDCQIYHFVELIGNVLNFIITLAVFIAVGMFIWAGALLLTSGGNPSKYEDAKKLILSALIGFVIVLAAWLIVNTVLSLLTGQGLNWWIDRYLQRAEVQGPEGGARPGSVTTGTTPRGGGGTGAQCHEGNTACSVQALTAVGFSPSAANAMSCIAMTESSGNPNARSSSSSACGTFQTLRAHYSDAFVTARISPECRSYNACTNANCNAQVAYALYQRRGYGDWTCPNCNARAAACVNRYDPR